MTTTRRVTAGLGLLLWIWAWTSSAMAAERLVVVGQPAPEVSGGPWINSDPLTLAGLRGRVVLVEFWTYG